MTGENTCVFGIYSNRVDLGIGFGELRSVGFRGADISLLMPETMGRDTIGRKNFAYEEDNRAPEGEAAGTFSRAAGDGSLGWLTAAVAVAIPNAGRFIAAGPIMSLLAGVGARRIAGGLTGSLIGLGIPENEAKRYYGRVRSGGILVSVHCESSSWVKQAKTILSRTGAEDVA